MFLWCVSCEITVRNVESLVVAYVGVFVFVWYVVHVPVCVCVLNF